MNGNVNLNAMMTQVPSNMMQISNNKLSANNQAVAMDKNSFAKMLAKMNGINELNGATDQINTQLNGTNNFLIMDIMQENNLIDSMVFNDTNGIVAEGEEKQDIEKNLETFIMHNAYNFGIPSIISTKLNVDNDSLSNEYLQNPVSFDLEALGALETVGNNIMSKDYKFNNENKDNHFQLLNFETELEADKNQEAASKESLNLSFSAEKLITEIEKHRENLIKKIDFNVNMLTANKTSAEGQNIIKISDESNELKPQIMSQVKDMIVFTAEQGPEPGSTIRNVTMELTPASLGKVEIKMSFDDNKVTVEIKALNEETQKLIASNVDELAVILGKTSETVNIVFKSPNSLHEHQLYTYNQDNNKNNEQQFNQDAQNNGHGRQKNNYYYNEDSNSKEDDDTFSQLINLRTKINM